MKYTCKLFCIGNSFIRTQGQKHISEGKSCLQQQNTTTGLKLNEKKVTHSLTKDFQRCQYCTGYFKIDAFLFDHIYVILILKERSQQAPTATIVVALIIKQTWQFYQLTLDLMTKKLFIFNIRSSISVSKSNSTSFEDMNHALSSNIYAPSTIVLNHTLDVQIGQEAKRRKHKNRVAHIFARRESQYKVTYEILNEEIDCV